MSLTSLRYISFLSVPLTATYAYPLGEIFQFFAIIFFGLLKCDEALILSLMNTFALLKAEKTQPKLGLLAHLSPRANEVLVLGLKLT
ncbi:hypothetical protein D5E84_19995 [Vibrio parahaemolyticus]|nr:hypothetical protein D5E84_19995 [Vibrio parahaemolyticus]